MSIVFITIPGDAKREFADALNAATDGSLNLVLVQKLREKSLGQRLVSLYRRAGWSLFEELWCALLLRFNPPVRRALDYFRETTRQQSVYPHAARILELDSVNSDEAYEALKKLSPDLMVVWGTAMLSPKILSTAKRAINLHLGYCPYYRGALANQHAVLYDDFSKIGATIHYINEKPDAGNILAIISTDASLAPRELLRDLNDRARATFLEIASKLHAGETPPDTRQDISQGKNFLLKSWTPRLRYALGKKVIAWEKAKVRAKAGE